MNTGSWFTVADEKDLLWFDPNQPSPAQNEFRALYKKIPGFPAPTVATARAVDFEVICHLHPQGASGPFQVLNFAKKVPAGFLQMMRDPNKMNSVDRVRQAITAKHQFIDVLNYVKSQGILCCKCGIPSMYIGCKCLMYGPKLSLLFSTPQCSGERCRMECQAEADKKMVEWSSIAAEEGQNANDPLRAMMHKSLARGFGEQLRVCEWCARKDDVDRNGFKNQTCSRCKVTYYCSRRCQKNHWQKHRIACKESSSK